MVEPASNRMDRLTKEYDKNGNKVLDRIEVDTAVEMEALEGDLDDMRALRDIERANAGGRSADLAAARARAGTEATPQESKTDKALKHGKSVAKTGLLITASGVGIGWAVMKPFRWAANKVHDWGKGFLKKHDELGVIERTEDWFAPHDDKKKK